jgi:hypothetical protein
LHFREILFSYRAEAHFPPLFWLTQTPLLDVVPRRVAAVEEVAVDFLVRTIETFPAFAVPN